MAKRIGANQRLKRKEKQYRRKENRPALLRQIFQFLKIMCLVSCLVGSVIFIAVKSNALVDKVTFLNLKKVKVKGNISVKTSDILSRAVIDMGISLLKINASEIKKRIRTIPEIKSVKVQRRLPGTLIIRITERKPIAIINTGLMYLVDNEGFMWSIKPNTYWDLPIISGVKDTILDQDLHVVKVDEIKEINSFFKKINKIDKSFAADLSQVDFANDDEVMVAFESKSTIAKLSRRDIHKSVINLQKIFTTIENKNGGMPKHVNLCFNNIAFVK